MGEQCPSAAPQNLMSLISSTKTHKINVRMILQSEESQMMKAEAADTSCWCGSDETVQTETFSQ